MTNRDDTLFTRGLKKAIQPLQEMGYVGPLDLNTIVNNDGVWGLEFCPRFGYDGTALLTRLLPIEFGEFLYRIASGGKVPEIIPKHSFCASTRLSMPPYPCEGLPAKFYKAGVPINGLSEENLDKFFVYDVMKGESDMLVSAGICGWIGSPLAVGETIGQAFEGVEEMFMQCRVPNGSAGLTFSVIRRDGTQSYKATGGYALLMMPDGEWYEDTETNNLVEWGDEGDDEENYEELEEDEE